VKTGKIEVFGEIVPMMSGTTICDPEWQPYLDICEQYDVPLSVHTGWGGSALHGKPNNRLRLGDPYLIEDILIRYPNLRVFICHNGVEWYDHAVMLMMA
jgi:predicted TIM-barrel fold metal-dependent hydrolase